MLAALWPARHSRPILSKLPTERCMASATVWLVDGRDLADAGLSGALPYLGAAEMARFQRFVRPLRQRQFLIGRLLLRCVLSQSFGVRPQSISLIERADNAPLLKWQGAAPFFSISHSGPWVACALSPDTPVGLDIEVVDASRDLDALSAQAFDAADLAHFFRQTATERLQTFYQLWSRKEARYKLSCNANPDLPDENWQSLAHPELAICLASATRLSAALQLVEANLLTQFIATTNSINPASVA